MYLSIEEILSILNELEQEVKDESSHVKETKYISWNLLLIKRFKSKIIKSLKKNMSNILAKTKTYLVGHMQYASGRDWRSHVEEELEKLNITTFNPYRKPFVKDVEEDEGARERMADDMKNGYYNDVTERMRTVRNYDLNLVDRSDFIIAHILPEVASWGSAEELVTAVRAKKPIFISMEGEKLKLRCG